MFVHDPILSVSFGRYLKNKMKIHNVTQAELAEKIGVARSTVSMYTADITFPPCDVLAKIEKALNLDHLEVLQIEAMQRDESTTAIISEVKKHFGRESAELLEILSNLTKDGQKKLLDRGYELLQLKGYGDVRTHSRRTEN